MGLNVRAAIFIVKWSLVNLTANIRLFWRRSESCRQKSVPRGSVRSARPQGSARRPALRTIRVRNCGAKTERDPQNRRPRKTEKEPHSRNSFSMADRRTTQLSVLERRFVRYGQFLATLGTTCGQHLTTVGSRHTLAEPVFVDSLPARRLECPFHCHSCIVLL